MNELYKVLILLVFFGLGIPCASAANTISFNPQTVDTDMSSSQNVQIVMDEVPDGMSGFNITVSVLDPEVAEITAVSSPDWNSVKSNSTSAVPSSSVWISSIDFDDQIKPGDTNVPLGNITITGKKAGTSDLKILEGSYYNPDGSDYTSNTYPDAILGKINVLDKSDTVFPVINSVELNDNTPKTGDSILVTVDTTDNVGVSSVKANAVSLVQSGNIWNGSITAVEGTHSVNVSSADEADNVAWDNDTSYTTTTPDSTDTVFPIINSVKLNDNTPKTGNSIRVTVNTTDNVGVSSVKANAVSLVQSGNIWNGSITAVEGTHSVNVSSADEADNVAWDNDTSY
ncbi:MAG: hypothetical protein PHX08_14295, partial [Lachnospiraceae bacterium]|nr:hypothetical protein [Lachnospiraceae bacterium]